MKATVKEVMSTDVVAVRPETPLLEATKIMLEKDFRGLPVIREDKTLVGILTEYDLILKGSSIHLPTFIKMLQEIDLYKKDEKLIAGDLQKIFNMKVEDAMNREPLSLLDTAPLEEATKVFTEHHKINPILVVNTENKLTGVLSRHDMLKMFGTYNVRFKDERAIRQMDKDVNAFLRNFEKRFMIVSRFRTQTWLLFSAMFFLIGFLVAFALIIRINV
jgi:CBS domain-containing protein